MNLEKRIVDQDLTEEEKRLLVDWLDRIADGRLVVRVPEQAFGIRLGENCDRAKVRELCEEVKIKPPTIIVKPEGIVRIQ